GQAPTPMANGAVHDRGVHRPLVAAHPQTLSARCKALWIVCPTSLGAGSRSNIRYPRHKTAATTKAPPLGGFDSTAVRPKPARGLQRSANEVCQTSGPCHSLIATRLRQAPLLPRQL